MVIVIKNCVCDTSVNLGCRKEDNIPYVLGAMGCMDAQG